MNINTITQYKGLEIDSRLPDEDEVENKLLSQSMIGGSLSRRMFNLRTLEEIK